MDPQPPEAKKRPIARPLLLAGLLFLLVRAGSEIGMICEFGSDPQMSIWVAFFVFKIMFWLATGGVVLGLTIALWKRSKIRFLGIALAGIWFIAIGNATYRYAMGRQALADASNPGTSPTRLQELTQFHGIQSGYELDNRLASNPATPANALRELSHRREQTGTLACLRRNHNTPNDVLQAIGSGTP